MIIIVNNSIGNLKIKKASTFVDALLYYIDKILLKEERERMYQSIFNKNIMY